MAWLTQIITLFTFIGKVLDWFTEKDKVKKQAKQEALDAVKEGIKNNDPSSITSGFDRYNRV